MVFAAAGAALALALAPTVAAQASQYVPINGEGSTWAGDAWAQWKVDAANDGVTFNYTPNGSSAGRDDFAVETSAMFADSEIPFTGAADDPQDNTTPQFTYAMLPVVAGGTSFAYNLPVNGVPFTNLKLNMSTIAGIFSGKITNWDASQIRATNPGVALPDHKITVVVREDGSGATAQFKLWMLREFPADYEYLAKETGGNPNAASSYYPVGNFSCSGNLACFVSQSGSDGVTTYTQHTQYSIDYDEYAYPLNAGMPVAKVENAAGYFTLPTADAVAVALTQAIINDDKNSPDYLSQDLQNVYGYKDPRSYPMSMYTYEMIPTQTTRIMQDPQGATLAWVSTNAVCSWQAPMGPLGYSPLPMNLVLASMDQIEKIPGINSAVKATISDTFKGITSGKVNPCNSPTFRPGDSVNDNYLVQTAPFPPGCDAACQAPWIGKTCDNYGAGGGSCKDTKTPAKQNGNQSGGGGGGSSPTQNPSLQNASGKGSGGTSTTGPGGGGGSSAGSGQTCNAATGVCTSSSTGAGANGSDTDLAGSGAVASIIPAADGWASPQTLGIIVIILVAAILVAPPVVAAVVGRRGRRG